MYVPRGDTLTPLITEAVPDSFDMAAVDDLALESWALSRPMTTGRVFAFPLLTEAGTTAVVAGLLSDRLDLGRLGVEQRLQSLLFSLEAGAVHLDTALLFAAFRDAATAEERRRLAREMHDGVAQDIASLGYLVDALAAKPASPEQAERIQDLRKRVTAVVAEVRRSVVTLRTSVGASESLGTAIGSIARNLTEVSGVPIHVTLDELHHPAPLRGRGRAVPHRPGGDDQRGAPREGQLDPGPLPGARSRPLPSPSPTTDRGCSAAAATPTVWRSCASGPCSSMPSSASTVGPGGGTVVTPCARPERRAASALLPPLVP